MSCLGFVTVVGRTAGSHQLHQEQLFAERPGGTEVLTSTPEDVSVDTPGGHEAEDLIRDILFLQERLIHLIVRRDGDGWPA